MTDLFYIKVNKYFKKMACVHSIRDAYFRLKLAIQQRKTLFGFSQKLCFNTFNN